MRLLYFYQYFTIPKGTYSTRIYEYSRRWVRAGDSVTIVTGVYDKSGLTPDAFITKLQIEGVDVRLINIGIANKHGFVKRIATALAYAVLSCWYALTLPADVVISSSGPLSVAIPGLLARYIRRLPFVFEVRDLWLEGSVQLGVLRNPLVIRSAKLFEKFCCHAATEVVALSEGMAEWLKREHGISRVEVIPNGSDNQLFGVEGGAALPSWVSGKRMVVYAGTLGLIDDCSQILDMAAVLERWREDDIEVVIIGSGKERLQLEQRAKDLGLGNVRFLGEIPKVDLVPWLRKAACALFVCKNVPFLDTASPNKLFDAFAAGTPVVQTSQGWIKGVIEREHCGINVAAGDPEALARGVVQVVHDDKLRDTLAVNARRVAKSLFDRDLLASKMHEVVRAAATARSAA
jgi:glycosyltransferase involved in cell wall biosynthesis